MPLPKVEHPVYEIFLQSLGKKVKFRPFLVKEEKVLLMAKESKDADDIRLAIKQIITNCAVDPIDVETLPLFDVEMIFLKLRAKSVGENVRLVFNCQNEVEGVPCNTDTDYTLDLNKIKYDIPEGHDPKIMLNETVGIKLKYPTLALNLNVSDDEEEYAVMLKLILENIDYIFDKEAVYKPEDMQQDEVIEFLNNLTMGDMANIQKFFESAPKVVLQDTVKCKKCGFEHKIYTEDLIGFFT